MEKKFERNTFGKRLSTMLKVDFRRMLRSRLFYIIVAACLVAPMLILIMTTLMDGTVSVDPQTGKETVTEGFDNVWQIIGTVSGSETESAEGAAGSMSLTSMVNINMLYFAMAVLVCIFIADDFRSGYAKNLFTVRAKKSDYVISKTLVCIFGGACMILAFFAGSMIGGAICNGMFGLPFTMEGFGVGELILCMISKLALVAVFVPIYLAVSVIAKQKTWMSLIGSFAVGMLLFMMIPALTPLNQTVITAVLCFGGGALSAIGLGAISGLILKKTSLV
ncbi:MAG: ABC transporter permease [Clostridia bacterium]|nr:ABC transporter permease [Clostridia bacterium]